MRFTYNQYNYYESGYRIPSKMHSNNGGGGGAVAAAYQHHHKSNFGMRMTMSTASTMTARIQRKGFRTPSKRHPGKALPGKLHSISRIGPGKLVPGKRIPQRPHPPPCDNSNDSGFGFDQHVEVQQQQQAQQQQQQSSSSTASNSSNSSSGNSSSGSSSSNATDNGSSSSTSTNLNSTSSHHHSSHHNHHHNHHHQSSAVMQHSPHLIRAIPASRSTPTKKLPFDAGVSVSAADDDDNDDDFCTDDSDDYFAQRHVASSSMSSLMSEQHYDDGQRTPKMKKLQSHVELDNDDACSEDAFIRKIANATAADVKMEMLDMQTPMVVVTPTPPPPPPASTKFIPTGPRAVARVAHKRQPATPLNSVATSSDGRVQLEIVSQPEQQHRARYQTEGSRGAVKDRSGNGFPIVRLVGYNKPAVLQVFIGTDIGRVAPHMFYQACKVAGKNSTQCNEKKVDGTMVIEIDFKPESDMTITCDCVGILKERNVDVEHRFPDHLAQKNKKKSTRCRMVFRTQLAHDDGTMEMLQVCSNPIICTQPPGVPEICKKSLNSCPVDGGLELFIIGKNFLKDTHVIFQETFDSVDPDDPTSEIAVRQHLGGALWEQTVLPDKEYLQQTHLICTVPPYIHQNIFKSVTVQLSIVSSGKKSESHSFVYTPKGSYTALAAATTLSSTLHGSLSATQDGSTTYMDTSEALTTGASGALWPVGETKHEIDSGMMPPPISTQMPMGVRRPSLPTSTPMLTDHLNVVTADALKTELLDESSQSSLAETLHSPEAVNVCGPHSPTALQYHTRYGRKSSMDTMMYDSSSLPGFPTAPSTVAAAVEMVKNEIAKEIINAAVAQQQQQQQQAVAVDKFITDLAKSTAVTADAASSAAVVADESLFGVGNSSVMDHPFGDILQQASAQQPAVLERSLSISSNSSHSSSSSGSSPHSSMSGGVSLSPSNSLNGHNSPITQDIILNSEPAAALSVMPMQQLLPASHQSGVNAVAAGVGDVAVASPAATATASGGGLSTEMIMNTAVSPSTILCSANGAATAVVPNIMAPHQVTMVNSILNDIAMQSQPTQQDAAVAALALTNIIMSPPNNGAEVVSDVMAAPQNNVQPAAVTAATTTAVSNMIIKAAADLISNQEQQQHQHQQIQQHQHQHQQQQQQQQMLNANSAAATSPLVNLLLNHPDVPPSTATAAVAANEVQSPYPLGIPTASPSESLIVALATENAMQKSVAAAAVTTNGAIVTQQTAATAASTVPLPPPIPQELTTMSDQDLLSFINPSTFDQL